MSVIKLENCVNELAIKVYFFLNVTVYCFTSIIHHAFNSMKLIDSSFLYSGYNSDVNTLGSNSLKQITKRCENAEPTSVMKMKLQYASLPRSNSFLL